MITCKECGGEGTVTMITNLTYSGDVWDKLVECPECNGTGEVECQHDHIKTAWKWKGAHSYCPDCGKAWDADGNEVKIDKE